MISIAVCVPEKYYQAELMPLLETYDKNNEHFMTQLYYYSTIMQLESALKEGSRYDLLLVDLEMEEMKGLRLMEDLRSRKTAISLMGISDNRQLSYEALKLSVSAYFVKPISAEQFYHKLDHVLNTFVDGEEKLYKIDGIDSLRMVPYSNILYIERYERSLRFHLTDGAVIETRKLRISFDKKVEELLHSPQFIMTHSSFVINVNKTVKLSRTEVVMKGGDKVPVSARRYRDVREAVEKVHFRAKQSVETAGEAIQFAALHPELRIFDKVPFAVAVIRVDVDRDGQPYDFVFMYANEVLAKLERVPKEKLLGKSFYDVFDGADRMWLQEYYETAYHGVDKKVVGYRADIEKTIRVTTWQPWYRYCACITDNENV